MARIIHLPACPLASVWRWLLSALLLLLALQPAPVWAEHGGRGHITTLSASDAPAPGQSITITATVQVDVKKTSNSNLYYQIFAPDGVTVVATHTTNLPSLDIGQSFDDSWSTTNSTFPSSGTYSVTACWSTGNSSNCGIHQATTTFSSVPSLGWLAGGFGLALLAVFLWRRREQFSPHST